MDIKEAYEGMKKKFDLPEYDILNNHFEVYSLESDEFVLREIRRKIVEKIEAYIKILESVLQPEASVCDMQECHAFSEEEKQRVYSLYKKMMYIHRYSIETSIDEDDAKTSRFIKKVVDDWNSLKDDLVKIISKLKESWKKESDYHEVLNYMG